MSGKKGQGPVRVLEPPSTVPRQEEKSPIASNKSSFGSRRSAQTGRQSVRSTATGLMFKCFDSIYGAQRVISNFHEKGGSFYGDGSVYGDSTLRGFCMTNRLSQNGGDSIYERPQIQEDDEDAKPDIKEEDDDGTTEDAHQSPANLPRQKPTLSLITTNRRDG